MSVDRESGAVCRVARMACIALITACSPAADRPRAPDTTIASDTSADSTRVALTGAGASFPYPLYARWFNDYATQHGVRINYMSTGSGAGIRDFIAHAVDFGATDMPMTDAEVTASGATVLHIPTVLGAVAITYNLPEIRRPLRLSGALIADIFLGTITRWNDARIVALNPSQSMPDTRIAVVHRGEASGTSYIFTDYLTAVSPTWAAGPARGRDVQWPIGDAENGNEGVAGRVKQTIGSIGYLEVIYARQNRLPVAHVQNRAGRFASPMAFEIASAAATSLSDSASVRTDLRVSLVNPAGEHAYPISSFTWLLVAPDRLGPVRTRQLVDFLEWAMTDGGDIASSLGYVPLPTETADRVLGVLNGLLSPTPDDRSRRARQQR